MQPDSDSPGTRSNDPTGSTEGIARLDQFLTESEKSVAALSDLEKTAGEKEILDACRAVCLATREAFMECTSLRIEEVPLEYVHVDRLYAVYQNAIFAMDSVQIRSQYIVDFLDLLNGRFVEVMSIRRDTIGVVSHN